MILLRLLIVLIVGLPAVADAQFANRPSGLSTIYDCPYTGTMCPYSRASNDRFENVYSTQAFDNFGNAPLSPPSVMKSFVAAGAATNTGNGQWINHLPNVRQLFFATWWNTNAAFAGWPNNTNKMLFARNPAIDNNFLVWQGPQGSCKTLKWYNQAQYANNHLPNTFGMNYPIDGTGWFEPNQGNSGTVCAGAGWKKIEVYLSVSTTTTSRDGVIKWWLDGVLIGHHTGVNLTPNGITEFQVNHTWDGGDRGSTTEWAHYWDQMLIAASSGGGGGGGTTDTTPPSQVTGVTCGSITASGATCSWSPASDNIGVSGYQFETCTGSGCTNFGNTQSVGSTSITLTGLSPSTTYNARVKAVDAAGNVSTSYSTTATWTTLSASNLPTISFLDADSTGAYVAWTGSPGSIRVTTDTLNLIEPMTAFPVTTSSITKVQSRSVGGSGSSISLAYTSNNAAGNLLILRYAGGPSNVTISNCTDTRGNTWTDIPNATGGTGGHQAMRYAANSIAGANTVTCTLSGSATFSVLDIFEYSGAHTTAPLSQSKVTSQTNPGTGANAVSSGNVTTAYDGELVVGATLQVGETVYNASTQFSGTQGPIWYYKDSSGTNLTYNGSYWQGSGYLGIWQGGGHPGNPLDAMLRWVAPADGAARITGTSSNVSGCGTNGTVFTIKKNGATIYGPETIPQTGSYPYDVSTTVVATDTIDFLLDNNGNDACDSTNLDPTITLGTASGSGGTTTSAGTGYTIQHATYSDSPIETKIQTTAGSVAATFTGGDASNDYVTSIATFRPGTVGNPRYSRVWASGTTFVCMYARDSSGNENTDPSAYRCDPVTTTTTDITPPVRSNPLPTGTLAAGTTSTTISIATDEAATCKYGTSAGVAYGSIASSFTDSQSGLFHSATVSSLSNGNTYTYYVRCQDLFNNANTNDTTLTFSVAAVATDTTAPSQVTGLVCQALNATQISCTWNAATDNVAVTGYEVFADRESAGSVLTGTSTTTSVTLSNLTGASFYVIKVRAKDSVGNLGTFSDSVSVLTPAGDTTRPSDLTGLTVTPVDFQALDVSWTAGTDNVGIAATQIEMCQGANCTLFALQGTIVSGTTLRVSGLSPITTYRFRGKHADAAGNVSANYSPIVNGTTDAVPTATVTAICRCKHHR